MLGAGRGCRVGAPRCHQSRFRGADMRDDNYEAGLHELQLAKDEAEAAAEDFYKNYWPFQTDEIAAQYGELQFTAVIMLAEFERFAQQGSIKPAR